MGSGGIYVGLQIISTILPCHPILRMRKLRPRCRNWGPTFRPHSSALTPCPPFPQALSPSHVSSPLTLELQIQPPQQEVTLRPPDPDFSAMEDEQAGCPTTRWAGVDDSSGASTLCLAPAFYQALCVQYFRELLKHSRVVIMPFHR